MGTTGYSTFLTFKQKLCTSGLGRKYPFWSLNMPGPTQKAKNAHYRTVSDVWLSDRSLWNSRHFRKQDLN